MFNSNNNFHVCGEWSFLHTWDDESNFVDNPRILSFTADNIKAFFTDVRINVFEPFGWTLKAAIVAFFRTCTFGGDNYTGVDIDPEEGIRSEWFRQITVVLHSINSMILHLVIFDLVCIFRCKEEGDSKAILSAAITAASVSTYWAIHPVNVETIGWPSAQPYSLALMFVLLSVLAHTRAKQRGNCRPLFCALLFFFAIMSKSAAVTAPAIIMLIDVMGSGTRPLDFREYTPSLVVVLVMLVITFWANVHGSDTKSDLITLERFGGRVLKSVQTILLYFKLFFWPENLRAHYVLEEGSFDMETNSNLVIACGVVCGTILPLGFVTLIILHEVLVLKKGPHDRSIPTSVTIVTISILTYLALFLPTCGIVQHGMVQMGGDRYAYIPYLGLCGLLAGAIDCFLGFVFSIHHRTHRAMLLVAFSSSMMCIFVSFYLCSQKQLCTWCDDESMFRNNLAIDGNDWRMVDTYAEWLYKTEGLSPRAITFLRKSLEVLPRRNVKGMLTRAKTHVLLGEGNSACDMYISWWNDDANDVDRTFPLLINNVAICNLRNVDAKAVSMSLLEDAMEKVENPIHLEQIKDNYKMLEEWGPEQGNYGGSLMF